MAIKPYVVPPQLFLENLPGQAFEIKALDGNRGLAFILQYVLLICSV
jgi:hypothetical protein